jgi:iron(III) transport system substrate-binding protein
MRATRREALAMFIAAAATAGITQDASSQPAATKSLVLYASHPTAMVDHYVKAFEQQNPGVKIELITGGTGDLLGRVKAEKDRPRGDLLWGGSSTTGGSAPDLFVKYEAPALKDIAKDLQDPTGFNAPFDAFAMLIVYNKDLVAAADVPKTWADLGNPKWKGKVRFANPVSSSSSYAALVNWKLIGGWELVERLARNMIIDESSSAPFTAVAQGEAALGVAYEEGAYRVLKTGKVGIVYPSDGVVVLPGGLFLIKGGPNPVNAKKFADFVLATPQQQALVDNFAGRRPASNAVKFPAGMPAATQLKLLPYPNDEAKLKQKEWLAKWREIMIETR